tara:strand:- start:1317 stop:1538 length:222 start_codon:yes stop_codon:yes gene_type:complete
LFRFSTRSKWDEIDRAIQAKKFYATLPHKLDDAEQKWLATQPQEKSQVIKTETGTFGEAGWAISKSHQAFEND